MLRGRLSPERRQEVSTEIGQMSTPNVSFYVMVAISTIIAAYGLLANSTAVVIGAMLVAPLMGPIFGIALGLLTGDKRMTWTATVSEVMGVILAVGVGVAIGLVPLELDYGSEILSRTQPTIYDIIVALAAGFAGAYAMVHERLSASLPGVAIAVAVVPPLATCGLCIADAQWDLAGGAFLLFLANFLAIQIAVGLVLTVFGMTELPSREIVTFGDFFREFWPSLTALLVVGMFMTQALLGLVSDQRFSRQLRETLSEQFSAGSGTDLSDIRYKSTDDQTVVIAAVLTPVAFQPSEVQRIENTLRSKTDGNIHLIIRSLISTNMDSSGPVFVPEGELKQEAEATARAEFLSRVSEALRAHLQQVPGAYLANLRREDYEDRIVVTAEVSTPIAIEPSQVAQMEEALAEAAEIPVRLVVRSLLVRYADAVHYLYEPEAEKPTPLTEQQLKLHKRLEQALGNQLRQQIDEARLTELRMSEREGRILVAAVVNTPWTIGPEEVAPIQRNLRQYVHPRIDLTVASHVGGYATASGYVESFQHHAPEQ